jgi:hypothetical protein
MPVSEFTKQNRQHAANTRSMLKSGFLDSIGTAQSYVNNDLVFESVESVLLQYGELFVRGFSEELDKANANATGSTDASIRFEFSRTGKLYEASFYMSDTAKFTDLGVQGAGASSVNTSSPYKFKFLYPSAKHIAALEKWITAKNVTAIITVPKGIASKATNNKGLAYAMGYSIKRRGLRATYFKKKTVERLIDDFKRDVIKAAGDDMKINILF